MRVVNLEKLNMKKVLVIIALLLCSIKVNAQDVMTQLYGRTTVDVKVKVLSIFSDTVIYKRWGNLDGPSYEIKRQDIHKIVYENGNVDYFTPLPKSPKYKPVKFQCYIHGTATFAPNYWSTLVDMSYGVNIYDYLYTGLYLGSGFISSDYTIFDPYPSPIGDFFDGYIPFGVDLKCFFLKDRKVLPFVNCVIGGFWGFDNDEFQGLYCQAGAGFDVSYFTFGVKYNAFVFDKRRIDACAISVGVRFGGWNKR